MRRSLLQHRHACLPVRRRAVIAGLLALAISGFASAEAAAAPLPSTLVNAIDTSRWSPPSPDPSGLAYDPTVNRLLVVDGEVDEVSIYAGANFYESTLSGTLERTANTLAFSPEAVGVGYDSGGRLFVADDDADRIYQVNLGTNGRFDSTDSQTAFSTASFGTDPEGLSYDRTNNRLFVAGGENNEIYELLPVDGTFGNGNDQVRTINSTALGITDPETVEYNEQTGTLYTIDDGGDRIIEITTAGALVSEIDTSQTPVDKAAGLAYAPRSTDPTKKSFYVSDRKVDNDADPNENDGAIYEIAVGEAPPQPDPGDRRIAASSDDAEQTSTGSMGLASSDLELVTDGADNQTVGLRFADLAIPAGATITGAHIQFTADESQSVATDLSIRAQAADNAPTFTTASSNVSSRAPTSAGVSWAPPAWTAGQAGTAQRTPSLTSAVQEVVNRSVWASGNAMAFIVTGTGHRTAESFDGAASSAPVLHVEWLPPGEANQPPQVSAGSDQTITLPSGASLDGTVTDDGRPNANPTTAWSKVSGPGTVNFGNPSAVDTQATFSEAGTYVLRLAADDGALSATDDMTVVANPATGTTGTVDRRVIASSDDAEQSSTGSMGLASSDLELVTDKTVNQTVGMRFADLAIPAGATITGAHIQFTADESQSVATDLSIRAQAADNAPTFTTASSNVSSRAPTSAGVSWAPPAWTAGQAGTAQRTPSLTSAVQEVVSRSGWASGNAMAFIVTGTGHRTAESFDGSATAAPLLHVEYRL